MPPAVPAAGARAWVIKGRVFNAQGMVPLASARPLMLIPDRSLACEATADSQGRFRTSLPAVEREYRVVAWQVDHFPAAWSSMVQGDAPQALGRAA